MKSSLFTAAVSRSASTSSAASARANRAPAAVRLPPAAEAPGELALAWSVLSDNGRRPLVVRSSSPVEDQDNSSMAGLFTSIVGVAGWAAFEAEWGETGAIVAPEDIAEVIAFLCSPAGRCIRGQNLIADAGVTLPFN